MRLRQGGCLLDHGVTTFPELTDALARDLGVTPRVLGDDLAATVLTWALSAPGVPRVFRRPGPGLIGELLGTLAELKAAYVSADDLRAMSERIGDGSRARAAALADVYARYERALERIGATDRHGREWQVHERLVALERSRRLPGTLAATRRIVFVEIYDFSVVQFLIATTLVRLIGDAELVTFAHAENVDATRFLDRTWNRFVGDPGIADQVLPTFVDRSERSGALAGVVRRVFDPARSDRIASDGSIRLTIAPGRYAEVEAAVREIRRRLESGADPERIAILARSLTPYRDLVEDVSRRYRVPIRLRQGVPVVRCGVIRACLNVIRCVEDGIPRERLSAVLESGYFRVGDRRLVRALAEIGFVGERGRSLTECVAHRLAALAAEAENPGVPAGRRASVARRTQALANVGPVLGGIVETLRHLEGARSIVEHTRRLRRVLRRLRIRPAAPDDFPAAIARRDAQAWTSLEEALDGIAGLARAMRTQPVPLTEFRRLLQATLEARTVEEHGRRTGAVQVLGVAEARGLDFDSVFLLGLDDGTFPAPRSEGPLLGDALKRTLNPLAAETVRAKLGSRALGLPLGALLRTTREASLEEPFLFFLALSMAERDVVLSYPSVDDAGNPTVPSPFLEEVERHLESGLPREELPAGAVVPPAGAACETAELVARASLDRWAGGTADRLTAALAARLPDGVTRMDEIDRRARVEDRRARYFLTGTGDVRGKEQLADEYVGRLGPAVAVGQPAIDEMRWSPSRLEELAACGFKFFAARLLGLGDPSEAETEVDPREQGTLYHHVLAGFVRAHPELPADLEEARALGRRYLAAAEAAASRAIVAKDPAFFEIAWSRLADVLDTLIVAEQAEASALAARGLSVEHLVETEVECRLPVAGGGAIVLAGRVDRLDVVREGTAIVGLDVLDYKVSDRRERFGPLLRRDLGETAFQIPVYLLAASATHAGGAPVVLRGGYVLLLAQGRQRVIREFGRSLLGIDPPSSAGPPTVADRIAALVGRARQGRFDVSPRLCETWCPYLSVCRYQRPPLEPEEAGDA